MSFPCSSQKTDEAAIFTCCLISSSVKSGFGGLALLILATLWMIFSAFSVLPREINQRADSGTNLRDGKGKGISQDIRPPRAGGAAAPHNNIQGVHNIPGNFDETPQNI